MFTQQQESKENTQTPEQIDSVRIEGLVSCLSGFCELFFKKFIISRLGISYRDDFFEGI